MSEQSWNEQLIIDYLLGDLPESETERLDELSVANDEFAEFLLVVENDLVDAYVRNELPENKRARFQSHYLASSRRREKVAFAQTFLNHVDHARTIPQKVFSPSRKFEWAALAAALVMLSLAGYLLVANIQLRRQIAQMKEEHTAFQLHEEKKLAPLQKKIETLQRQPADHGSAPAKLFAFTLLPQQRGISSIPNVVIPPGTESLALTAKLESDDFSLYETALKDPATDKVLWRSGQVKSMNQSITIKLPANLLKSQNYVLEISGISGSGQSEIISGYPFHVAMQ